jgi:hypothetical protein
MDDDVTKLKAEEQEELENSGGRRRVRRTREDNRWLAGAALIAVGLFLLLTNVFSFAFGGNWWAVFILIPALYNLQRAWRAYQHDGGITNKVRGNLISGLMIGAVALIFLFDLNIGRWWPLFLVIFGVSILLRAPSSKG